MYSESKKLREERASLVSQAGELLKKAKDESRELSQEENEKFDKIHADADQLKSKYETLERQYDAEQETAQVNEERKQTILSESASIDPEKEQKMEDDTFRSWLSGGISGLSQEQRQFMQKRKSSDPELRAQSMGTDSAGGYTVPPGFVKQIEQSMLTFGGMREASFIMRSSTGNDIEWPTVNDTGNTGALLAENAQVSEQDVTFASKTLNAYKYTSKLVRVSNELLNDSAFNLQSFLANLLGERIARITNTHFTTGTGSSQPNGVVTGASNGKTGASGQTASVIYNDLVDLQHSVDPSYRRGARFMMHDSTLKALKKLIDGQSRPLWLSGVAVREPDSILGHPYTINQDVAEMAASAKSILFGDFSKYIIRDVMGITMMRLNERYADYFQVGFVAFSRHDGDLLDSGTDPIKYYTNAAS
jgi:HK97 family phage major capsid protein